MSRRFLFIAIVVLIIVSPFIVPAHADGAPPYSPVARFTEDPETPYEDQLVTFNASTSQPGFDGDDVCDITEYSWDFGDGEYGTGEIVTHIYDEPGDYVVTLTVYAPGIPPYIDPQYTGTNTTDTIQHIKTVKPVGGYAVPIDKTPAQTHPIGFAFTLAAALVSTIILTLSVSVAYIKYRKKQ